MNRRVIRISPHQSHNPIMLPILDQLPDAFLDVPSTAIHEILPQPTLIHLSGTRPAPVFVSILLHGNEDVGLKAVQQVLRKFVNRPLPRSLSIFVGNVTAAALQMRRLPGQPDYNRVWPGSDQPPTPEHALMAAVVDEMQRREVFVSVDLHNNTERQSALRLRVRHRSPTPATGVAVQPHGGLFYPAQGVQTQAFMKLCPAITCECGKVGTNAARPGRGTVGIQLACGGDPQSSGCRGGPSPLSYRGHRESAGERVVRLRRRRGRPHLSHRSRSLELLRSRTRSGDRVSSPASQANLIVQDETRPTLRQRVHQHRRQLAAAQEARAPLNADARPADHSAGLFVLLHGKARRRGGSSSSYRGKV